MPTPVTRYVCPKCDNDYADEMDAQTCCDPDEETHYECDTCREIHPTFAKANACHPATCPQCHEALDADDADGSTVLECRACSWKTGDPQPPTPAELEAAGQQRLF